MSELPMRMTPVQRISSRIRRWATSCAAALALVAGLGCEKSATGPREVGPDGRTIGRLVIVVPVGNLTATSLVVEVSAVDITPTMVFNMPVVGGVATGSIAVPAGSGRLFTVKAFDGATETHRGTKVLAVVAGVNPSASITLAPLAGTVPIIATLGSLVITVTPLTASPRVGDTLRFAATIRDAVGAILPGPARWASTNTAKLVVDTAGLATVVDTGTITVVATYSTSAGIATVTALPAVGGPVPGYLRTWVGGSGTGSIRNDWATANNWTPAFVPTAADSVVIGAATFQPNIPTDTFTVRDLVLRTGGTLSASCCGGIRLRVARVVSGEGGTFGIYASLLLRNGAQLRGVLPTSITVPTTVGVALIDSARINSLTVDGIGADFSLAGKKLVIMATGAGVVVNNGGLLHMTAASDTLDTQGYLQITTSAAPHLGALSAGRIIIRNANSYLDGFQGSGTNTVEFANTVATSVINMDYVSRPANAFQNVIVSGPGGLTYFYYNLRVLGTFDVLAGAGPVGTTSSYTIRFDGPVTTAAGTTLSGPVYVDLRHASGTAGVNGAWSPAYTDFNLPNQTMKVGLAYQNVRFFQSQTLSDTVRIAGDLRLDGASTVLNITSPRKIILGSMNLTTSATFVLDAASDTLEIHGDLNTNGGGNSSAKLTDGTIILWGTLHGQNYSGTGNNLVKFDNPGTGVQRLNGFNPAATPVTGLANVEVTGSANVDVCSSIRIGGSLKLSSPVSMDAFCYPYYGLYVTGPITTVVGSTLASYFVQMGHISGTNRVAGNWSPGYTDIVVPGDTLKPGLAYNHVRFYSSSDSGLQRGANYTFNGDLTVDGAGVVVGLRGSKLTVNGLLHVTTSGRLLMVDGDTLSVAGNINWYSSVPSPQTGGQITWGGQYLNMTGYNPGGMAGSTHKLKVTNAVIQPHINTTDPTLRPFARLEVSSPFGVMLDGNIAVKDSFVVSATGAGANVQSSYYYSLETRGVVVSAATSTIRPAYVSLNGTTSLADVAGNFTPGTLFIYQSSPGLLRNAPGFQYADIQFHTSYTLTDSLTTTPNATACCTTWPGNVSINGAGTVLDLGGKRMRLSGGFDANTNAIFKMITGPSDTLMLGDGTTGTTGQLYLDAGASANAILNTGTIILRGSTSLTNVSVAPAHTLVLTDSGLAPAARTFTLNSTPTLGNVIVRGSSGLTVQYQNTYTLNGFFDLQAGPTFTSNYYYVWKVNGPVTTAVGSAVTGLYPYIELAHPSGTSGVNGLWSPYVTRFNGVSPTIKPTLAYQNMEFNSSASFSGNTTLTGYLYATGAGTTVGFGSGGNTVNVGGYFNLETSATLSMTEPLDTLKVAGTFDSENGGTYSNVTAGVIRVRDGVNANRLNPTGSSKFVLDSLVSGAVHTVYTNLTPFNKLEIRTNRTVRFDNNMTFNDTVNVLSPTTFGNSYCCYVLTIMGPLLTVASSSTTSGGLYFALGHASGTSLVNGTWNPYVTRWITAGASIKPGLDYQNMEFNASNTFSGNTTLTGYLYAQGAGTVVNFGSGGRTVTVGGYFNLETSATLSMTDPLDTLKVAGTFDSENGGTFSNVTAGVIRVRDGVNANRLNPTGSSKFVLDSLVSGAPQPFYINLTPWNNVEVRTNRTVRFDNTMTFNGALDILTPTVVGNTCCYTFTFAGPVSSVALSTLQGGNLRFNDVTAADNLLGGLNANANEVQLNTLTSSNVPVATRFAYQYLRILGVSTMPVGATLKLGPGGASSSGTLYVDVGAQLFIPSTSTLHACNNIDINTGGTPGRIDMLGGLLKSRVTPSAAIQARIFSGTFTLETCL